MPEISTLAWKILIISFASMLPGVTNVVAIDQNSSDDLSLKDNLPKNCVRENSSQQQVQDCQKDESQTLTITSRKVPFVGLKPTTQATNLLEISEQVKVPTTLTALVEGIPGVAENSQPGLYQVISIRGVSRQRILSFVDGVRLSSERRAGVAASFIDPLLLEQVKVTRGPVSTYYGSGAIGGVTQLSFKNQHGTSLAAGYNEPGDQQVQTLHWGNDSTHGAIVTRQAENSRDIDNNLLNTHFEQTAGYLKKTWLLDNEQIDSWIFSSNGNDIGRSNSRFPNRIVNVPEEKHTLFKTSITNLNHWSLDFYLHDQSITTTTLRPEESFSSVTTESLDFGSSWQTAWERENQSHLIGLDFYSRDNVNTKETKLDLISNQITDSHTLNDGQIDELALFYTLHKKINDYRFQLGGRYTVEKFSHFNSSGETNNALTGFAGFAFDLSPELEINANVGNAFRFASLTERFFSGTTARGNVAGNRNLQAEKALTYDLGFSWKTIKQKLKASVFLTDFSDYIERVEIEEDSLSFINIQQGKIKGLEAEYHWMISPLLDLNLIATFIQGENAENEPLSDIPSDRINLSLDYQTEQWQTQIRLQHRSAKNDPGSGELSTNSANILAARFAYQINHDWSVRIYADNLLNETYVSSADELSTLASGRNFGFLVNWQSD